MKTRVKRESMKNEVMFILLALATATCLWIAGFTAGCKYGELIAKDKHETHNVIHRR